MKAGDLVKRKRAETGHRGDLGLFVGFRKSGNYEYAEVMWFKHKAPNGDAVSSVQISLLEVVNESR